MGSLEFLDKQPMLMPWPNTAPLASQVDRSDEMADIEPADLVIMNPPFTRDRLRYDQFDVGTELTVKEREKELFANMPTWLSGYSGAFIMLADYINRAETGGIAAVLPLVAATDFSGAGVRERLGNNYHVETIVASHDPERIYFSENTSIGEMLVTCRRWPSEKGQKPPTKVVNLARNPSTPAEAKSVAWAIDGGAIESQGYGTVQEWPASRIASGNWGAVQFLSPYLCNEYSALEKGDFFGVIGLGAVSRIGPEGRRIRDAFTRSDMPDEQGRLALWFHDTDVTKSMAAKPDFHIRAKPSKIGLAVRYWEQRSRLLLPNRFRLNTARVDCVRLEAPAVGSAWSPCNIDIPGYQKEMLEKAICLFLNSTTGILSLLGSRTLRENSYPRFSLDDLRKLTVPNFAVIGVESVEILATAYDRLAEQKLLPLPQMHTDPVRLDLDDAVCQALNLDPERVQTIRRNLAAEPSVTAKRYAGLRPAQ